MVGHYQDVIELYTRDGYRIEKLGDRPTHTTKRNDLVNVEITGSFLQEKRGSGSPEYLEYFARSLANSWDSQSKNPEKQTRWSLSQKKGRDAILVTNAVRLDVERTIRKNKHGSEGHKYSREELNYKIIEIQNQVRQSSKKTYQNPSPASEEFENHIPKPIHQKNGWKTFKEID